MNWTNVSLLFYELNRSLPSSNQVQGEMSLLNAKLLIEGLIRMQTPTLSRSVSSSGSKSFGLSSIVCNADQEKQLMKNVFAKLSILAFKDPTGIPNKGNTCFANTILQCLLSYYRVYANENVKLNGTLEQAALNLANAQFELTNCIFSEAGAQQDADEYLYKLFEHAPPRYTGVDVIIHSFLDTKCIVHGCSLKVDGLSETIYMVQKNTKIIQNKQLLQSDSNFEDLFNLATTEKVNKKHGPDNHDATVREDSVILYENPKLNLIFSINRTGNHNKKLTHQVTFPLAFDLCSHTYELYAFTEHENKSGTISGGHWIAIAKRKEKWYKFSDDQPVESIHIASYIQKPEVKQKVVMLFYHINKNFKQQVLATLHCKMNYV